MTHSRPPLQRNKILDTTTFDDRSPEAYKQATKDNWTNAPCGSNYGTADPQSKAYFDQVEAHRYKVQDWLKEEIQTMPLAGKRVLEIGFGMGTDHLLMARQGAEVYGVDLTANNAVVTRRRFSLYQQRARLSVADGEQLPYPDATFDVVYSFGVIHHSPNTEAIIAEIHRVLKPGGFCYITVYHKHSVFFWWNTFLLNYLIEGGFRQNTLKEQLSLIEYPNTNKNMVIRLYTRPQFHALFQGFDRVDSYIRQLVPLDFLGFQRFFADPLVPPPWMRWLGRRLGWYVVVRATK